MRTRDEEEQLTLSSMVHGRIRAVAYLVTNDERESRVLDEHFPVLTHELMIDVAPAGRLYFTWAEEPSLNGHPIRLSVLRESSFDMNPDLSWLDASGSAPWSDAVGVAISAVRLFREPSAYEGVSPPAVVMTGVEFLINRQQIQVTVITPADDLNTPLSDGQWSPSTVITVGRGYPDLSRRPEVQVEAVAALD